MSDPEPTRRARTWPRVLAAVLLGWGAFTLAGATVGICFTFFPPAFYLEAAQRAGPNPFLEAMARDPIVYWGTALGLIGHALCGAAYLAAGVGLWSGRRWGRSAAVAACVATLVLTAASCAHNIYYVFPLYTQILESSRPATRGEGFGALLGTLLSFACTPIVPVACLVALRIPLFRESAP